MEPAHLWAGFFIARRTPLLHADSRHPKNKKACTMAGLSVHAGKGLL